MSPIRERDGCRGCDPEAVFELADGELDANREFDVRAHVEDCPECRELYERELALNSSLGAGRASGQEHCSVSRAVAMALPTRPAKVRVLWTFLSVALLFAALVALQLSGANPVNYVMDTVGTLWGFVSEFAGMSRAFFAVAGPVLLISLGIGAILDVIIAAAIFSASRHARRA